MLAWQDWKGYYGVSFSRNAIEIAWGREIVPGESRFFAYLANGNWFFFFFFGAMKLIEFCDVGRKRVLKSDFLRARLRKFNTARNSIHLEARRRFFIENSRNAHLLSPSHRWQIKSAEPCSKESD